MAEKADMPSDTVSLPPNYAPSETYTESPPPAYKQPGMAAVRVAKIVCLTALAMTFVIGFFIVAHKWVQTRSYDSHAESSKVMHAALFAQAPNNLETELNNNFIDSELKINDEGKDSITINNEEKEVEPIEPQQGLDALKEVLEEQVKKEADLLNEAVKGQVEEVNKDVKLPVDHLFGNPALAGRNVHCKVEKRQQQITQGIMTQAIIVTCDDEEEGKPEDSDEENDETMPIFPINAQQIRPPMSLLSSIMKVLSARPRSPQMNGSNIARVEARPMPIPMRPIQGPFPMSMQGPMLRPLEGPFPSPIATPGGVLHFVPVRRVEVRRPESTDDRENQSPITFQSQAPTPQMRLIPGLSEILRAPRMHAMPFMRVSEDQPIQRPPFPLQGGPFPIRVIRLPQRENNNINEEEDQTSNNEENQNAGPFPFPAHPLMKLFPPRTRIIRLRPRQQMDESSSEPLPFPFPRGALPLESDSDDEQHIHMSHPMPEASGRALPSPVAIPELRVMRFPFRPQPQNLPEARVITHMEVRQPPSDFNQDEEPQIDLKPPGIPENQNFRHISDDFGPPKTHTVIESVPEPIFYDEERHHEHDPETDIVNHHPEPSHEEPITQTQFQPRFLAPPPPNFAREGRSSFLTEKNPDAELIGSNSEEPSEGPEPNIHRLVLN